MENQNYIQSYCTIRKNKIFLNGALIFDSEASEFSDFAKEAYKKFEINYPRFFKMDALSKLAFLASELARHITGETMLTDAGHHLALAGVTRR